MHTGLSSLAKNSSLSLRNALLGIPCSSLGNRIISERYYVLLRTAKMTEHEAQRNAISVGGGVAGTSKSKEWSTSGIELETSCTRSRNHASSLDQVDCC